MRRSQEDMIRNLVDIKLHMIYMRPRLVCYEDCIKIVEGRGFNWALLLFCPFSFIYGLNNAVFLVRKLIVICNFVMLHDND
jgi:hypothetical protein